MLYNTLYIYIYIYIYIYPVHPEMIHRNNPKHEIYPVHPEMIHRNNPKHEIFRFDIQSEMATETEFKTLDKNDH